MLEQWRESPVTVALAEIAKQEVKEFEDARGDAYSPFDPQRTQETMANINGAIDSLELILPLLLGIQEEWDHYLEKEEEEESGKP